MDNGERTDSAIDMIRPTPEKEPQEIYTVGDLKRWMHVDALNDSKTCTATLCDMCHSVKNSCMCSKDCLLSKVTNFLPIIGAFKTYKVKEYLLSDFIAGLTVGIMHIPQGMGFALLAGLPPVIGLYTSFFPVLMYFFFTPSRSTSFGSQSLVCLMLGSLLERECIEAGHCSLSVEAVTSSVTSIINSTLPYGENLETTAQPYIANTASWLNLTGSTTVSSSGILTFTDDVQFKVTLAVTLAFLIGSIQMLMSVFRMGVISLYFSPTFISACNCGAAFQIATTQVKFLLGLVLPPPQGRFGLAKTWVAVVGAWREINVADLVVSVISIVAMVLVKKLINERYKEKLKIPIPIEIIVVVLSTAIARFANLSTLGVNVVGVIPQGIPPPALPALNQVKVTHVMDAIPVALIGFLSAVLMAKMFANKYEYQVDINQELFANGAANFFSSFFSCFPSSVAPPRTMLFDSVGGKTQIAYIFSCVLVLLVLVLIGPLFQTLPTAVLASIIVVALIPLFEGMKDAAYLWKVNKLDFFVWFGTLMAVIIIDLGPGIVIGVFFSIISVVLHTQKPKSYVQLPVQNSDIYLRKKLLSDNGKLHENASNAINDKVIVYKFDCPLYYANYEKFVNELTGILMPYIVRLKQAQVSNGDIDTNANNRPGSEHELKPLVKDSHAVVLVLDCSAIHYLDVVGIKVLKTVYMKLSKVGIKVTLAGCSLEFLKTLERSEVLPMIGEENIFFHVHDAVTKYR